MTQRTPGGPGTGVGSGTPGIPSTDPVSTKPVPLWMRKWSLIVRSPDPTPDQVRQARQGDPGATAPLGEGIDLSQFRFTFRTQQGDGTTPNNLSVRVYNLNDETVNKIKGEYDRVYLEAGYQHGPFAMIFTGTIKQYRRGRENALDSYLDILAADGDLVQLYGTVNQTLTPPVKPADIAKAVTQTLISQGYISGSQGEENISQGDDGGLVNPRGAVLYGLGAFPLAMVTETVFVQWSIQNGQMVWIPMTGYHPAEVVLLNSKTGMVGQPEQTDNGISIRSLLNPLYKIGGRVQINNRDINQLFNVGGNTSPYNDPSVAQDPLARITDDGLYRIITIEHEGDTRGNDWYTNLIALDMDATTGTIKLFG